MVGAVMARAGRLGALWMAGWLLCMTVHAAEATAGTIDVVDDRGAHVHLNAVPQRIVSLLPSLTESVCALGACAALVAVDRWSNWPASVRRLPRMGGLDDANVELIVAQRPDLVLLSPSSRLASRLRSLGLKVAELDAQDLPQVQRMLTKVAMLVGRPGAAEAVWRGLQADIQVVAAAVPVQARGIRVYFEVSSTPYAAGEVSFIGQLLTALGVRNVVPASLGPFPKLNPEFIVRADPDVVMVAQGEVAGLAHRPGWAAMKAISKGHICALSPEDYDVLSRPGPRLGQAARVLSACLIRHAGRTPGSGS